jgi:hypothetical protein
MVVDIGREVTVSPRYFLLGHILTENILGTP